MNGYRRQRFAPLISLLLLVLVARALVPVGFMPAADGSAQLTMCPDGMLMPSDAPMMGHGTQSHVDHCPFGSAPFAAPLAATPVLPEPAIAFRLPASAGSFWLLAAQSARTHQARAPPV